MQVTAGVNLKNPWMEKLYNVWKHAHAIRLWVSLAILPMPHVPNTRIMRNTREPKLIWNLRCQKNHIEPMTSELTNSGLSRSSP